jgi:hypothetical protein
MPTANGPNVPRVSGATPEFESLSAFEDGGGIATGGGGAAEGAQAGGAGGAEKVCPHCTFVNEAGASDCDICGLPL